MNRVKDIDIHKYLKVNNDISDVKEANKPYSKAKEI